jgi:hypothetical protein
MKKMKRRDLWIGIVFLLVTLLLLLGSLRFLGAPITVMSLTLPSWLPACYAALLFVCALGVLFRQALARLAAILLIVPLVPLSALPVTVAEMASLIRGAWVIVSLLFAALFIWLLLIRFNRDAQNA